MMLSKTTTRKFYGKWLYKTSLHLEGCVLFRMKTFDEIEIFCSSSDPLKQLYSTWQRAWINRANILKLISLLKQYSTDAYAFRIESNVIDVYTNDKDFYEQLSLKFAGILRNRYEPNEATVDMLNSDKNYISVDKLPKGRYNYRVYLLPHKMKGDKEGKIKFLDWVENRSPSITCTTAMKAWFLATEWNWDRRYVLVEDEQTLLMLKLRNSDVVGKIYNFVVSDK